MNHKLSTQIKLIFQVKVPVTNSVDTFTPDVRHKSLKSQTGK
jgi:hypothetical protein